MRSVSWWSLKANPASQFGYLSVDTKQIHLQIHTRLMQATFALLIMCTHGARSLCGPVMSAVKQIHPYVRRDIIHPQTRICYEHVTVITPMGMLPIIWKFDVLYSTVTSYGTPIWTLTPARSKAAVLQASLALNSTNLRTVTTNRNL